MLKKKLSRPGHVGLLGETYAVQASQFSQAMYWGGNLGELLSVGGGRTIPWLPHYFKCQRDLH